MHLCLHLAIDKVGNFRTKLEKSLTLPDSRLYATIIIGNADQLNMIITGLSYEPMNAIKCKTLEKRFIFKLGTLIPTGLNKQFSYLS